jgi:hypothetical protein
MIAVEEAVAKLRSLSADESQRVLAMIGIGASGRFPCR